MFHVGCLVRKLMVWKMSDDLESLKSFDDFIGHLEFWWLRVESKGWDIFDMVYVKCGCSF